MSFKVIHYTDAYFALIAKIHDEGRKDELKLAGLDDAFVSFEEASKNEGLFHHKHVELAMLDEEVVGFIAYDEEEIAWLYIDKRHRLEGTASKLIEHALKIEPCIYYVECLKVNVPARKLYEKHGFELVDTCMCICQGMRNLKLMFGR